MSYSGIIGGALGVLGTGIQGMQNRKINLENIYAQQRINQSNIDAAMKNMQQQREWALEDRDYNSESAQYKRLLALGLSPAAARAALSGGQSNLGGISAELPTNQQAYMQQPTDLQSGFQTLGNAISSLDIQKRQQQHEKDMQAQQFEHEAEMHDYDQIYDMYSRSEVREQEQAIQPVWQEIVKEARNADFEIAGKSREEVEQWLKSSNESLLSRLDEVSANSCANDLLNQRFERLQTQSQSSEDNKKTRSEIAFNKVQQVLGELSTQQLKNELQYQPQMLKLALAIQRNELKLSDFDVESIEVERLLQQYDLDLAKLEKEVYEKYGTVEQAYKGARDWENMTWYEALGNGFLMIIDYLVTQGGKVLGSVAPFALSGRKSAPPSRKK